MSEIHKLRDALYKASVGAVVVVIAENAETRRLAVNSVVLMPEFAAIPAHLKISDTTNHQIFFQPKGSIRFAHKELAEWDPVTKTIRGWPGEVIQIVLS